MTVEDVVLSAHDPVPAVAQNSAERVLNTALVQRNRSGRQKFQFELFNHQILSISIQQAWHKTRTYELQTCVLDPNPGRSLSVSWQHLATFLACSFATVLAGYSDRAPFPVTLGAGLMASAGLGAGCRQRALSTCFTQPNRTYTAGSPALPESRPTQFQPVHRCTGQKHRQARRSGRIKRCGRSSEYRTQGASTAHGVGNHIGENLRIGKIPYPG